MPISQPVFGDRPARTILVLALAPAVGIGICRFAYSLLLPDMRASLGWSYATAGFMNTANAIGYLAGALIASTVIRKAGLFGPLWYATWACVASLVICAFSGDIVVLSLARFLAGVTGAIAFIAAASLATTIAQAHPARLGVLMGLLYTGPGIGIFVSGLVAPFLLEGLGPGSWWIAWGVLAALASVMTFALILARAEPSRTSAAAAQVALPIRSIWIYLTGYALFGAGYIAYMTFMIAFVRDAGGGALAQSAFWTVIALGAFASPYVWSRVIGRSKGGGGTAIVAAATSIGALIPFFSDGQVPLAISGALFGVAFFSVTSSTTAFVRANYPPQLWPKAIALMTIAFGLGQIVGPVVTGAITDAFGSLRYALAISAAALALGAAISALQKPLQS